MRLGTFSVRFLRCVHGFFAIRGGLDDLVLIAIVNLELSGGSLPRHQISNCRFLAHSHNSATVENKKTARTAERSRAQSDKSETVESWSMFRSTDPSARSFSQGPKRKSRGESRRSTEVAEPRYAPEVLTLVSTETIPAGNGVVHRYLFEGSDFERCEFLHLRCWNSQRPCDSTTFLCRETLEQIIEEEKNVIQNAVSKGLLGKDWLSFVIRSSLSRCFWAILPSDRVSDLKSLAVEGPKTVQLFR